jgi:flagellar biosynthesis anti-sigma factor FlgM
MKIDQYTGSNVFKAYKSQIQNNEVKSSRSETVKNTNDTLELSDEVREFQQYRVQLANFPAIREDRVAALRREIQDQTYLADPEKIIGGMEKERMLDKRV